MPLTLQAKLLRVLQEKKVSRVGSEREIELDIKIISSVGKPPREAIREGELRMDLFYRLGVVMVKIPPLRQRGDDIQKLINHFLVRLNTAFGAQVKSVSPEVMELFAGYAWPGNIRELEHLLEGAMNIVGLSEQIDLKHFSAAFDTLNVTDDSPSESQSFTSEVPAIQQMPAAGAESSVSPGFSSNLQGEQMAMEKTALHRVLQETGGNVSRAAQLLGISRQLLTYKMRKHKLSRKVFEKALQL
jgi:arginine utilization regulatory protein